jgi:hypothetical protein
MMSVSWPNVDRQLGFNVGVPGVSDLRWCAVNRCRWWRREKVANLFWKVRVLTDAWQSLGSASG